MNTSIGTSRGQAGGRVFLANPLRRENLHPAGFPPPLFGRKLGRLLLLDEGAADATQAEVDREREAYWTGTNDEDLGAHTVSSFCSLRSSPRKQGPRAKHLGLEKVLGPRFRGDERRRGQQQSL